MHSLLHSESIKKNNNKNNITELIDHVDKKIYIFFKYLIPRYLIKLYFCVKKKLII